MGEILIFVNRPKTYFEFFSKRHLCAHEYLRKYNIEEYNEKLESIFSWLAITRATSRFDVTLGSTFGQKRILVKSERTRHVIEDMSHLDTRTRGLERHVLICFASLLEGGRARPGQLRFTLTEVCNIFVPEGYPSSAKKNAKYNRSSQA
ncbi:unnamed protein product [Nesidiocoris tenuis]|uniref:Uncharacterized protein n=1 Tax=Nesidiocoris tenuis TaxID=355587 RepID=A0A6H5G2G5_9HEMI|nr:unnamed protein product [Nesidiocoris tenuis]